MAAAQKETAIPFLRRQVREMRTGGTDAVRRKIRALPVIAGWFAKHGPTIALVLMIRALRWLVLIRFVQINSSRYGPFAFDTELYLQELDAGSRSGRTFDIYYFESDISNHQLEKMWGRTLRTWQGAGRVAKVNRHLPGGDDHVISIPNWSSHPHDMSARIGGTRPHLAFTQEEEELGRRALVEMGVPDGAPFVCFHARDSAYLDAVHGYRTREKWAYHDYRDSNIHNYVPAVEELGRRGGYGIRMGAVVDQPLGSAGPKVIDYAVNHRTEFLDVYLGARCRFFLGAHSGAFGAAVVFRRPMALVNVIPIDMMTTWGQQDLLIPKKLWNRRDQRFMTVREMFDSGAAGFDFGDQYERLGVDPVENTAEEITAVALEMDARLEGSWQGDEEDEELQARFWELFRPRNDYGPIVSRMGAQFLRDNRELLG